MSQVTESLADRYRRFADDECHSYSPLYARLARAVAGDATLQRFIAGMPDPQPNLFFASIQYLSGPSHMPAGGPELGAFVAEHGAEVGRLMRSRHTQTNEIGRCAALLPALPSGPLALVEVGASAGLCLLLDRLRYEYGTVSVGSADAAVTLRCAPVGETPIPLPARMPRIVWRRGLDLDPVEVDDPDATAWLLACVWADQPERRHRLEAALALARSHPVVVERGDLVDDLPALLARAPSGATLVVFHSAVLPYVEPERRVEFEAVLARLSARRHIVWISNEGPGVIPRLDELAPERGELRFRIGRTTISSGRGRTELLALAHYHGRDLEWLA